MWKLTYPYPDEGLKKPLEKRSDSLRFDDYHFREEDDFYIMTINCEKSVTTKGSKYPRLEFRELEENGDLSSWDFAKEKRTMVYEGAILEVPSDKKATVFGQVHDDKDDIFLVKLKVDTIFIEISKGKGHSESVELVPKYELGEDLSFTIECGEGKINVACIYKGKPFTLDIKPRSTKKCYFKVGNYAQGLKGVSKVRLKKNFVVSKSKPPDTPDGIDTPKFESDSQLLSYIKKVLCGKCIK